MLGALVCVRYCTIPLHSVSNLHLESCPFLREGNRDWRHLAVSDFLYFIDTQGIIGILERDFFLAQGILMFPGFFVLLFLRFILFI